MSQNPLQFHEQSKGKIGTYSKVPLRNRDDLSLAYTPGVAEVSRAIAKDRKLAYRYTSKGNLVAVVSDGSAVLGLGNIGGAAAMPVMEGKSVIFKEFGGIDAFPICLATQDQEEIVLIVQSIAPTFGAINLEDIAAPKCFYIEEKLKQTLDIPVFHDDQHGTAIVVLAGLLNALKVAKKKRDSARIVISGAGAAGVATTKFLLSYGFKDIILSDTRGAIYAGRKEHMNPSKEEIAQLTNKGKIKGTLADAVKGADVFIGVSAPGILTPAMVKSMKKPIIFAMANPIPEIMPDEAKKAGAVVVATGRSDFPNQINNSLAFPGVFRGALDSGAKQITEGMKVAAAEALAGIVKTPTQESIIPSMFDRNVVKAIAKAVADASRK